MLIRFNVENFLSFNDSQEISMIPGKIKMREDHLININSIPLLKLATIYGANASGKSNFVEAARYAKTCIVHGIPKAKKRFCRMVAGNENKDSKFEFEICKDGRYFAYGFTLLTEKKIVTSEWLYEIFPHKNEQCAVFERIIKDQYFSCELDLPAESRSRINIYGEDSLSNANVLFLNEMNRGKPINSDSGLKVFADIYGWFEDNLTIIRAEEPITKFDYFFGDEENDKINEILEIFDTGISKIKASNISLQAFKEMLGEEFVEMLLEDFNEKMIAECTNNEEICSHARLSLRAPNAFFNISGKVGEEPVITTIKLEHGVQDIDFDFNEESDGTRRLFDLLDILINSKEEAVYIIDELDRSLHPKLTYKFIELFIEILSNKKVQLVFTTHESVIMDQELLRRDEIWFVDRDNKNLSKLYSLDRFKERYDKKISKSYLDGRYGAIPVFKDFKFKGEQDNWGYVNTDL